MLGIEQTGADRGMSMFHTEKWNSVSKMDLDKLDFSPSKLSTETSRKNIQYTWCKKKVDVHCEIVRRYLWKKLQRAALA